MRTCLIVDILSRMPGVRFLTGRLVEEHVAKCGICRSRLLDREEARSLLVSAADVGRVESGLPQAGGYRPLRVKERRGWIGGRFLPALPALSGAAAVLALVVSGFWLLHRLPTTNGPIASTAEESFRISRIEIEGEPANAYIYRPRGTDMVIVWAERKI